MRSDSDEDRLCALVDEAVQEIELYRVEAPKATIYRLDEEGARDAVLAYALRDEIALMSPEMVPADSVRVKKGGWIVVGHDL